MNERELEYCRQLIRQGFELLPIAGPAKNPANNFMWRAPHTPEERLKELEKEPWGVGIPCNSNLLCFDFDSDADEMFLKFLTRLWNERFDLAYRFWYEKTPHGYHMIFRVNGEAPGNTKLASRNGDPNRWSEKHGRKERADEVVVQIETRGDGGYFVTYPSPGYVWCSMPVQGGANMGMKPIWELEPITEADIDWLFEMARSFNTYEAPVKVKKKATPELSPERKAELEAQRREERRRGRFICDPMMYYGAEFTQEQYEQLLKDYGWQKMYTDSERRIFYQRPGKGPHETDHSGNLADTNGCWLLYVFTTNSELPANCGLAAWQLLMYWQGCTSATCPGNITHEEIRKWKEGWFKEQALGLDKRWGALVENMEIRRRTFH